VDVHSDFVRELLGLVAPNTCRAHLEAGRTRGVEETL
jgi:hypothetical protein